MEYIDLKTVAKKLDCHPATLRKAIKDKELEAVKGVWRGYRTTWPQVQDFLNKKATRAGGTR